MDVGSHTVSFYHPHPPLHPPPTLSSHHPRFGLFGGSRDSGVSVNMEMKFYLQIKEALALMRLCAQLCPLHPLPRRLFVFLFSNFRHLHLYRFSLISVLKHKSQRAVGVPHRDAVVLFFFLFLFSLSLSLSFLSFFRFLTFCLSDSAEV